MAFEKIANKKQGLGDGMTIIPAGKGFSMVTGGAKFIPAVGKTVDILVDAETNAIRVQAGTDFTAMAMGKSDRRKVTLTTALATLGCTEPKRKPKFEETAKGITIWPNEEA